MADLKPLDTKDLASKFAWQRPERKDQSGSLVIFGGASLKLKEVDSIFKSASSVGVGTVYALVPESLARVFKRQDPYLVPVNFDSHFGLSDAGFKTLSEEFSLADSIILADLGKSSTTHLKLATLIAKSFKPVILTDSAIPLLLTYHSELLDNPNLTLFLKVQSLQKLIRVSKLKLTEPLLSTSSIRAMLKLLAELQEHIHAQVVLVDQERALSVSSNTYLNLDQNSSEEQLTSHFTAWRIWSPNSTSLECLFAANSEL